MIHQGHRYSMASMEFIALESGSGTVKVSRIDHDLPYPMHAPQWVHASQLTPMRMRYFHGQMHAG